MISHNLRAFAFTILGLAFGTYILIFFVTQDLSSIDFVKAISHISTTVSINILFWVIFVKWTWKWKLFHPWLVQIPDLSGKWEGTIKSNYGETDSDPIPTEIHIHQTFLNVQVRIKTLESKSYSVAASFDIDKDRGYQQLFYSYLNTPKASVRERSEIHYGSVRLDFEEHATELEGEYWTSRKTAGDIQLKKVT